MTTKKPDPFIPLSDAAMQLGVVHRKAYDFALSGRLGMPQRRGGRLYVERVRVEAAAREQDAGK